MLWVGSPPSNEPTTLPSWLCGMRAGRRRNPRTKLRGETTTGPLTKKAHIAVAGQRTELLNTRLLGGLRSIRAARNVVQCIHVVKLSQPATGINFGCCTICDTEVRSAAP